MQHNRIAVFLNGWSNEYVRLIVEGIRREAAKHNTDIFVYATFVYWAEEEAQRKSMLNIFHLPDPDKYDGGIMLTNTFNIEDEHERVRNVFHKNGIPMVSTEIKTPGMTYIGTSNYDGMRELADHLIDKHGVKRIVFVSGIRDNEECAIRKQAVVDALAEHGLELMDTVWAGYDYLTATTLASDWIDEGRELPDAFVCANDHMALGIMEVLGQRGYKIPDDVIVTGFDSVRESKISYPLLASVSRQWDVMGEHMFRELLNQIENPDPDYEKIYPSYYVPSESCGCEPRPEDVEMRVSYLKNHYFENANQDRLDRFFQRLRMATTGVENIEDFSVEAAKIWKSDLLGPDFYICVEPTFFEADDEHYPERIRGYSDRMNVIFGMKNGETTRYFDFNTEEVYPGANKKGEGSDTYVIVPLNYMNYVIGYLAVKNYPEILYDLSIFRAINHIDALLMTLRQYIFSQRTNRELKKIYMTDYLSGMYNRTGCDDVLFPYIENGKKAGDSLLLMFVDINDMKKINDEHGHLNGDMAIKIAAEAMRAALPDKFLCGRYGGDEFIAVGPCDKEPSEYVQKIKDELKKIIKGIKITFKLSVGIGYRKISPDDTGTVDDYIKAADEAMYEDKKAEKEKERG